MGHGINVFVAVTECGLIHNYENVSEAELLPSGILKIHDIHGDVVRCYGPNGYKWFDVVKN